MPSWAIYGSERRRGMHAEPEAVNLLLSPSAFDAADWTEYGCAVTADTDGTGDSMIESAGGDFHQVSQNVTKAASSIAYDLSVRAKLTGDPRNRIVLGIQNGSGGSGVVAVIDVQGGLAAGVAPAAYGSGFSGGSAAITSQGSGWYLCELNGVTTDTDTAVKAVFGLDADSGTAAAATNYAGNGTSGIIIDQAILVEA
jgi:hypothetical protein